MSAAPLPSGAATIIFRPHFGQFEPAFARGVGSLEGELQSSGMAVSPVRAALAGRIEARPLQARYCSNVQYSVNATDGSRTRS
jgi:hypothetical protein